MISRALARTSVVMFGPLALLACGSSSPEPTASLPVFDPAPDVVATTCRAAYEALGFTVTDALQPVSVDFEGVLMGPGYYVSEGLGDEYVQGDRFVISTPRGYCEVGSVPAACLDLPTVAFTADGRWAVVQQVVPAGGIVPDDVPCVTD